MVLGSVLISFFYTWLSSFPSTTEETIFATLCILASFIKVFMGVWVYLWTFYLVPLDYISVLEFITFDFQPPC